MGFDDLGGGRFATTGAELDEIGVTVPNGLHGKALVPLSQIGTYRYDEAKQQIFLDIAPTRLKPQAFDARIVKERTEPAKSGRGMVLNYSLVGTALELGADGAEKLTSTAGVTIDGRVFSPDGQIQFGMMSTTAFTAEPAVRLDTTWQKFNEAELTTWRVGDAISGGLTWTRPIRLGGVQYQRNFALRPDLITVPLPAISGTAAVPSTLEVYVDGVRTHTQELNAGPYSISNVPVYGNAGDARIVLRDATGRITEFSTPFVTAPSLLRQGMFDWSLETGLPRQSFGTRSFDYAFDPVASGTLRYGWTEKATLEAHAEAGLGLVNAGGGCVFPIGAFIVTAAGMASARGDDVGGRAFTSLFAASSGFRISMTASYDVGTYLDLGHASSMAFQAEGADFRRSLSRYAGVLSVSAPLTFVDSTGGSTLGLTYIESQTYSGDPRRILLSSLTHRLNEDVSLYATTSWDPINADMTAYLGASITFDKTNNSTVSLSRSGKSLPIAVSADYSSQSDGKPGSFGWRTSITRGESERVGAGVTYTSETARVDATAVSTRSSRYGNAVVSGAIAMLDGEVYTTRTIYDSFAVVDVGHKGVEVLAFNNVVGKTDDSGRVFVPNLMSHQYNKLTIDPTVLPPDVQPSAVETNVVPIRGSGVAVDMRVRPAPGSALVEFIDTAGAPIATGMAGKVLPTGDAFIIGFDGQAFLETLHARNEVEIALPAGPCRASFAFKAVPGQQQLIEKVVCK